MSDFVGKDLRGFTVVLPESTWTHAQPHLDALKGRYLLVVKTIQAPTLVLDNPHYLPRPGEPARVGHERYVRFFEELNTHIIVPMKIIEDRQVIAGHGTVEAGTRIAVTIHPGATVPNGAIIWGGTKWATP